MQFEEVDITIDKPEYKGWFNMTAECLPRAMGRCFFNGERFDFKTADLDFSRLLEDRDKIYWLRGMK